MFFWFLHGFSAGEILQLRSRENKVEYWLYYYRDSDKLVSRSIEVWKMKTFYPPLYMYMCCMLIMNLQGFFYFLWFSPNCSREVISILIIVEWFNASRQVELNINSIAATSIWLFSFVLFSWQVCRASLVRIIFWEWSNLWLSFKLQFRKYQRIARQ